MMAHMSGTACFMTRDLEDDVLDLNARPTKRLHYDERTALDLAGLFISHA